MDKLKSLLEEEEIPFKIIKNPKVNEAVKVGKKFAYFDERFDAWFVDGPIKARTYDDQEEVFDHLELYYKSEVV